MMMIYPTFFEEHFPHDVRSPRVVQVKYELRANLSNQVR